MVARWAVRSCSRSEVVVASRRKFPEAEEVGRRSEEAVRYLGRSGTAGSCLRSEKLELPGGREEVVRGQEAVLALQEVVQTEKFWKAVGSCLRPQCRRGQSFCLVAAGQRKLSGSREVLKCRGSCLAGRREVAEAIDVAQAVGSCLRSGTCLMGHRKLSGVRVKFQAAGSCLVAAVVVSSPQFCREEAVRKLSAGREEVGFEVAEVDSGQRKLSGGPEEVAWRCRRLSVSVKPEEVGGAQKPSRRKFSGVESHQSSEAGCPSRKLPGGRRKLSGDESLECRGSFQAEEVAQQAVRKKLSGGQREVVRWSQVVRRPGSWKVRKLPRPHGLPAGRRKLPGGRRKFWRQRKLSEAREVLEGRGSCLSGAVREVVRWSEEVVRLTVGSLPDGRGEVAWRPQGCSVLWVLKLPDGRVAVRGREKLSGGPGRELPDGQRKLGPQAGEGAREVAGICPGQEVAKARKFMLQVGLAAVDVLEKPWKLSRSRKLSGKCRKLSGDRRKFWKASGSLSGEVGKAVAVSSLWSEVKCKPRPQLPRPKVAWWSEKAGSSLLKREVAGKPEGWRKMKSVYGQEVVPGKLPEAAGGLFKVRGKSQAEEVAWHRSSPKARSRSCLETEEVVRGQSGCTQAVGSQFLVAEKLSKAVGKFWNAVEAVAGRKGWVPVAREVVRQDRSWFEKAVGSCLKGRREVTRGPRKLPEGRRAAEPEEVVRWSRKLSGPWKRLQAAGSCRWPRLPEAEEVLEGRRKLPEAERNSSRPQEAVPAVGSRVRQAEGSCPVTVGRSVCPVPVREVLGRSRKLSCGLEVWSGDRRKLSVMRKLSEGVKLSRAAGLSRAVRKLPEGQRKREGSSAECRGSCLVTAGSLCRPSRKLSGRGEVSPVAEGSCPRSEKLPGPRKLPGGRGSSGKAVVAWWPQEVARVRNCSEVREVVGGQRKLDQAEKLLPGPEEVTKRGCRSCRAAKKLSQPWLLKSQRKLSAPRSRPEGQKLSGAEEVLESAVRKLPEAVGSPLSVRGCLRAVRKFSEGREGRRSRKVGLAQFGPGPRKSSGGRRKLSGGRIWLPGGRRLSASVSRSCLRPQEVLSGQRLPEAVGSCLVPRKFLEAEAAEEVLESRRSGSQGQRKLSGGVGKLSENREGQKLPEVRSRRAVGASVPGSEEVGQRPEEVDEAVGLPEAARKLSSCRGEVLVPRRVAGRRKLSGRGSFVRRTVWVAPGQAVARSGGRSCLRAEVGLRPEVAAGKLPEGVRKLPEVRGKSL
ncbi:hypothetical protein FNV43_RR14047 [Rhamnella rubrinervis]|uniref:Uncharacterized protein n=1 Tax=Rhamnella rubrinervis TaxID=2594499 RepID=A0A8K0H2A5_9ROSA|nr:hypothetical protein FNV43_RR14047 [Rhamnella rubrinervis]